MGNFFFFFLKVSAPDRGGDRSLPSRPSFPFASTRQIGRIILSVLSGRLVENESSLKGSDEHGREKLVARLLEAISTWSLTTQTHTCTPVTRLLLLFTVIVSSYPEYRKGLKWCNKVLDLFFFFLQNYGTFLIICFQSVWYLQ